jgi:hypothetical protein
MNRTLLLLTALALVPGCYGSSTCNTPGSVTFYWRFESATGLQSGNFNPDNPATPEDESGCTYLGVPLTDDDTRSTTVTPSIRITIDGVVADTVGCVGSNLVPGALLPGFFGGAHTYTIDAIRAGRVVFTASGTTNAPACTNTPVDVVLQAVTPADFIILYDVNSQPPAGCKVGGVPVANVPWELRNPSNQIVDSTCLGGRDPVTSACPTQNEGLNACDPVNLGFTIPSVALGNYTMNFLELWDVSTPTTGRPLARICGAPVVHDGFPFLLNLTAPTPGFCPTSRANPLVASTPAKP